MAGARSFWIVATLLTWGTAAWAQSPLPVNPRGFEFDFPAGERSDIVGYWFEVFSGGSDPTSAAPLKTIYLANARASRGSQGSLRLDVGKDLDGLADGEYVATLRVVGRLGVSTRSAPTEPFAVSGRANRSPPAARRAQPEPATQSAPVAAVAQPDNERHVRWWTIAVVLGIVLGVFAPFVF